MDQREGIEKMLKEILPTAMGPALLIRKRLKAPALKQKPCEARTIRLRKVDDLEIRKMGTSMSCKNNWLSRFSLHRKGPGLNEVVATLRHPEQTGYFRRLSPASRQGSTRAPV